MCASGINVSLLKSRLEKWNGAIDPLGKKSTQVLTTDLQRGLQLQQDGLAEEDLPGFDAEAPDLGLRHLDHLPRAASSHWCQEKERFHF